MKIRSLIAIVLALLEQFGAVVDAESALDKYEEMVELEGGEFWKGTDADNAKEGEYPAVFTSVGPFKINKYPVTNYHFRKFVREQNYKTTAEEFGWSFVFEDFVSEEVKAGVTEKLPNAEWWLPVQRAYWRQPEGKGSSIQNRLNYPAVHISYLDADAYCKWKGLRLPTDEEWEFAARGGLSKKTYPWGSKYEKKRMNIWQGKFPKENKVLDGYAGVAPVDAFEPQNKYGMYDMVGNVWEWTSTTFTPGGEGAGVKYTLRGGSFVDSSDGSFNHPARTSTKMGNEPDAGSNNIGFRCAADVSDEEDGKDEL